LSFRVYKFNLKFKPATQYANVVSLCVQPCLRCPCYFILCFPPWIWLGRVGHGVYALSEECWCSTCVKHGNEGSDKLSMLHVFYLFIYQNNVHLVSTHFFSFEWILNPHYFCVSLSEASFIITYKQLTIYEIALCLSVQKVSTWEPTKSILTTNHNLCEVLSCMQLALMFKGYNVFLGKFMLPNISS